MNLRCPLEGANLVDSGILQAKDPREPVAHGRPQGLGDPDGSFVSL
jgi:hypothetical protein